MKDDIVIIGAARTPVGAFNGAFGSLPAHELGKVAIKAALQRAGIEAPRVSEVIMGQILTAGEGQNPARQASIAAGIPVECPAWAVNQLCGSGLRTVALGYQAILDHGVDHIEIAHLHAVAQMRAMRGHAHGLLAARDHQLRIAVEDGLIAERHRAQPRAAQLVDAPGRRFDRDAG